MGNAAEAAVYTYIGLSLYFTIPTWWSFSWIIILTLIVIVGRILAVYFTYNIFTLCFTKRTISVSELMFICYGGMIRGVVAFALVMKIPVAGEASCRVPENCYTKE